VITDEDLDRIRCWNDFDDPEGWFSLAMEHWQSIPWVMKEIAGFDCAFVEYSCVTGGAADNECIISAMQSNRYMWNSFWWQSTRGGRYQFRVEKNRFTL